MDFVQWDWRKQQCLANRIQKIEIHEYTQMFLCVGCNEDETRFWFMKIFKSANNAELDIRLTEAPLSRWETVETLNMMRGDSSHSASSTENRFHLIRKLINCYGIIGFVRFIGPYYIIVITKRSRIANMGPCAIYKIDGIEMIPLGALPKDSVSLALEDKYKKLFLSVDLTVNFYFSYSYDLTNTLQYNLTPINVKNTPDDPKDSADTTLGYRQTPRDKYVWNSYLLQPLINAASSENSTGQGLNVTSVNHDWVLCIIHGFVSQMKMEVGGSNSTEEVTGGSHLNLYVKLGDPKENNLTRRALFLTMIARRSRCYAGTRFNKRGVNCQGHVANEVELEQIVGYSAPSSFAHGRYTSFVQIRGSVPLLWSQTSPSTKNLSFKTKPEIRFDCSDPCYVSAGKHFMGLLSQYGSPVIVFNLVKKRKTHQETKLTCEFRKAIDYLNQFMPLEHKLRYFHLDMSALSKQKGDSTLDQILKCAKDMVENCGIFYTGKAPKSPGGNKKTDQRLQTGIVRVNCVDCLDRTNTAQFALGLVALRKQLVVLRVTNRADIGYEMHCVRMLEEVYDSLGDTIALQYGSSYLVHRIEGYRGKFSHNPGTRLTPTVQSISRYYNNTFSDKEKQEAINVFLGMYRPFEHHLSKLNIVPSYKLQPPTTTLANPALGKVGNSFHHRIVGGDRAVVDDSMHGIHSLPLWDMESDYYLHHVFDTSITSAVKPNDQWFNPDVIKCLPYASNEVMKSEASCGIIRFYKGNKKYDIRSSANEMVDWFIQFYRPFRLTMFDVLLKLNRQFVTVDRLKLPSETIRGMVSDAYRTYKISAASNPPSDRLNSPDVEENGMEDSIASFDYIATPSDVSAPTLRKPVTKKFSLMGTIKFPLFGSTSRTPLVQESGLKRITYDCGKLSVGMKSPKDQSIESDNLFQFPVYQKNASVKQTKSAPDGKKFGVVNERYGLVVKHPSRDCRSKYESYIEFGKRSGLYHPEEKIIPTTSKKRQTSLQRPHMRERGMVDNGETLQSLFSDNKAQFNDRNSNQREVCVLKPGLSDADMYKRYVAMGKHGVNSVSEASQRKYLAYVDQVHQ